jgi:uncharacterized protein (TIGR03435 family)
MLFGITAWMESERFDMEAKATGKSSFDEDMGSALLVDRFQLRFHRETRQLKMQVLVVVGVDRSSRPRRIRIRRRG